MQLASFSFYFVVDSKLSTVLQLIPFPVAPQAYSFFILSHHFTSYTPISGIKEKKTIFDYLTIICFTYALVEESMVYSILTLTHSLHLL